MNLGMGSLPSEHIIQFTHFIKNGLDKLASPHDLVTKDNKWALNEMKSVIKEGKERRADIAGIIAKRLLNYAIVNEASFTKEMVKNYTKILESGILTSDMVIISVKKLVSKPKFADMTTSEELVKLLLGK